MSGGIDLAFGSSVTVSNTTLIDNQAIGGAGGAGATGGDGVGGGINVGTGVIYGVPGQLFSDSDRQHFVGNQAVGGAGGSGSNGGNGLGGGLSVLAGSSASVSTSLIVANLARAGGGHRRQWAGWAAAATTLGAFADVLTVIEGNHASTTDDNFGP